MGIRRPGCVGAAFDDTLPPRHLLTPSPCHPLTPPVPRQRPWRPEAVRAAPPRPLGGRPSPAGPSAGAVWNGFVIDLLLHTCGKCPSVGYLAQMSFAKKSCHLQICTSFSNVASVRSHTHPLCICISPTFCLPVYIFRFLSLSLSLSQSLFFFFYSIYICILGHQVSPCAVCGPRIICLRPRA